MASGITGGQDMDARDQRFRVRHRASIIVGIAAIIVLAGVVFFMRQTVEQPPVRQVETITILPVQPPKPPPPPPPPQQQMIVQPKMTVPETKPPVPNQPNKPAPPKPSAVASAAPPLGTSLKSNNTSNNFDLSGTPGDNGLIGGGDGEGGGGSRWGWYQSVMQTQINQALHANRHTTHASFQVTARVWVDATGFVTRVEVAPSGDQIIDTAIRNEVLADMRFSQPPPADMPMPIVLSLTGEAPLQ